jgi:hypothetical protein
LFLYAFSFGIATRITGQSKGFTYLVGIASYIYIIYAGWYGKLVLLFLNWLVIALGMGLFLFFISIIIHPSATPAIMKLAGEAGKMSANRASKEKEKRAIEEEIDSLRREIASMNAAEQRATEPQAKAYIQMQRANLEAQKRRLESRV